MGRASIRIDRPVLIVQVRRQRINTFRKRYHFNKRYEFQLVATPTHPFCLYLTVWLRYQSSWIIQFLFSMLKGATLSLRAHILLCHILKPLIQWHKLKQTISDVCSTTFRSATAWIVESFGNRSLLSRSFALTTKEMRREKCELVVARPIVLGKVHGQEDIETGWWGLAKK